MYKGAIGVDFSYDMAYSIWKEQWAWGIHHLICSIIPFPAAYLYGGTWAFILNRHTASLEIGFEVYDTLSRIHERLFTPDGNKTMPFKLFALALFHHSVSFCLIIPCNMKFGEV